MQIYANHARWLFWRDEIDNVFKSLANKNIDFLVLKGWVFGGDLYPNLGDRSIGDVDILIKSIQINDAILILASLGFQLISPKSEFSASQTIQDGYIPLALNFQNEKGVTLDLHTHLLTSPWLLPVHPIEINNLWREKTLFTDWTGATIYKLSLENNFLHLVSHIMRHGFNTQSIKSFQDSDRMLKKYMSVMDWKKVIERASKWHLSNGTFFVCAVLNQLFNTAIPDEINIKLKPSKIRFYLFKKAFPLDFTKGKRKNKWFTVIIGKMILIDHPQDMLSSLIRPIFPNSEFIKALYGKPVSIFIHWFQLIKYGIQN